MKFLTARLSIDKWDGNLSNPIERKILEGELESILTPNITRYLPASMQFSAGHDSISEWVDKRVNEALILCVHSRDTHSLIGLIILAEDMAPSNIRTIHLGYFLGEKDWGQGYATEIITALIANFENKMGILLLAGVDSGNTASARVLEKSGFKKAEHTVGGQVFFELVIS